MKKIISAILNIPNVKLSYLILKDISVSTVANTELLTIVPSESKRTKKKPTQKPKIAAIIWFSVIEEINNPIDINVHPTKNNPIK